jgi:RHH-type transcriptional regulator, rel operon repressor / antitoxin RelB
VLSVRLEPEVERRLATLAKVTGRTKSFSVREAVLAHLDEMEDRFIAIERLERRAPRVSLEELERELEMEG